MKKNLLSVLCCLLILSMLTVVFSGCKKDEPTPSPVVPNVGDGGDHEIQYNVPAEDMGKFELEIGRAHV